MNKKLFMPCFILILFPVFIGCKGRANEKTNVTAPTGSITLHAGDENYAAVDTKESVVSWKGSNSFGSHSGFVSISKGELRIEEGQLTGGAVEVDMKTIEDDHHDSDNNVIKHLKDPDFFDVQRFPVATIVITGVEALSAEEKTIRGNLTIKGITQPVSFPARIDMGNGVVNASGKLVIDRTRWDVRYKSGKFFDNLKDQAISDDIEFDVRIVAKK